MSHFCERCNQCSVSIKGEMFLDDLNGYLMPRMVPVNNMLR